MAVSLVVHAFPLVVLMLATAVLYSLRAVVASPFARLYAVVAGPDLA
jgi:hypothetical protein